MISYKKLFNILGLGYLFVLGIFFFFELFHGYTLSTVINLGSIFGFNTPEGSAIGGGLIAYGVIRLVVFVSFGLLILIKLAIASLLSFISSFTKGKVMSIVSSVLLLLGAFNACVIAFVCLIPTEIITFTQLDFNAYYMIAGITMSVVVLVSLIPAFIIPFVALIASNKERSSVKVTAAVVETTVTPTEPVKPVEEPKQ